MVSALTLVLPRQRWMLRQLFAAHELLGDLGREGACVNCIAGKDR